MPAQPWKSNCHGNWPCWITFNVVVLALLIWTFAVYGSVCDYVSLCPGIKGLSQAERDSLAILQYFGSMFVAASATHAGWVLCVTTKCDSPAPADVRTNDVHVEGAVTVV